MERWNYGGRNCQHAHAFATCRSHALDRDVVLWCHAVRVEDAPWDGRGRRGDHGGRDRNGVRVRRVEKQSANRRGFGADGFLQVVVCVAGLGVGKGWEGVRATYAMISMCRRWIREKIVLPTIQTD